MSSRPRRPAKKKKAPRRPGFYPSPADVAAEIKRQTERVRGLPSPLAAQREKAAESKKPHGPTFRERNRCICCGYIVNNPERFTWKHKKQTFRVEFAGRARIKYTDVTDEEAYDALMLPAVRQAAEQLGYRLVAQG